MVMIVWPSASRDGRFPIGAAPSVQREFFRRPGNLLCAFQSLRRDSGQASQPRARNPTLKPISQSAVHPHRTADNSLREIRELVIFHHINPPIVILFADANDPTT